MVKEKYIPDRGDIVWLNFTPQSGSEQMGKRPAVVVSPRAYNEKVGLGLFCPITSKVKGYPFEVRIINKKVEGVVLSDQIKSLDWKSRSVEFASRASQEEFREIVEKVKVLIF